MRKRSWRGLANLVALAGVALLGTQGTTMRSSAPVATRVGFARQMSWEHGQTATFSFAGDVSRALIYRMGSNGLTGLLVATVSVSHVSQPPCLVLPHGSADCGNWAVSASWAIPASAPSSIYRAVPQSNKAQTGTPIPFVVRCDECHAGIVVITDDATWQAYNQFGGGSLYTGNNPLDPKKGREYAVSYNRPLTSSFSLPENAEYPMLDWLTANQYPFQYVSQLDLEAHPAILLGHRVVMTVGHLEYASRTQRQAIQSAIDAGESFLNATGNEFYWKTDPQSSIDRAHDPYRTIVCYKETLDGAHNPTLIWTGTWRDRRHSPPADGGQPENTLTGQLFTIDVQARNDAIQFTAQEGRSPFLRNTAASRLTSGGVLTMPAGTLGYEWDEVKADGMVLPPGEVALSREVVAGVDELQPNAAGDYSRLSWHGSMVGLHQATLYQAPSGALVFSSGSVQWSWGLSDAHARFRQPTANLTMQQATANLLDDMGVLPGHPQTGLVMSGRQSFSRYESSLPRADAGVGVLGVGAFEQSTPQPASDEG